MPQWFRSSVCLLAVVLVLDIGNGGLLSMRSVGAKPTLTTTTTAAPSSPQPSIKCDPCPSGIRCVPPIQCPAFVRLPLAQRPQLCDLPGAAKGGSAAMRHGFCCTTGYNHTDPKADGHRGGQHRTTVSRPHNNDQVHHHDHHHHHHMRQTGDHLMLQIAQQAHAQLKRTLNSEPASMAAASGHAHSPTFFHNLMLRASSSRDQRHDISATHAAIERVFAGRLYQHTERIPAVDFELDRVDVDLFGTPLASRCGGGGGARCSFDVLSSAFRTPDGRCNNARHDRWGAAGAPMQRLLAPAYEDGIWAPRQHGVGGRALPNARTVSRELFRDVDRPHLRHNLLLMQFGQFLTHDVSHSTSITTDGGQSVSCCTADGADVLPPEQLHWGCFPIRIEPGDAFYEPFGQRCMSVVRSALAAPGDDDEALCGRLGYAKQLSKVSHYLDGSAVYGTDERQQSELRTFEGGELRVSVEPNGRVLLPLTDGPKACGMERGPCFLAGDGRSNQIMTLTALHQLFLREHNRVARALSQMNGHWDDERVFEEARRIVVAELQHIAYAEWLPYVIGEETVQRFGLRVDEAAVDGGWSLDYDADVNACVTSEFTTAAFRFGHSTVDGKFVVKNGPQVEEIVPIPDVMFDAARLRRPRFFDEILNTLTTQPMQQVDAAVTKGLSGFLFRGSNPFGLDLAAINVQRGRDHGIRSYNDYLEATGHNRIQSFQQFGGENAAKLGRVYGHPDDIDLWVGGLLEAAHSPDSLLGVTFAEIIADQFSRLRRGDRYFYDLAPEISPGHLQLEQLQSVRNGASMARLLCDNADGDALVAMSPLAFVRPDVPGNAPVSCEDVQQIGFVNLEPWRELENFV